MNRSFQCTVNSPVLQINKSFQCTVNSPVLQMNNSFQCTVNSPVLQMNKSFQCTVNIPVLQMNRSVQCTVNSPVLQINQSFQCAGVRCFTKILKLVEIFNFLNVYLSNYNFHFIRKKTWYLIYFYLLDTPPGHLPSTAVRKLVKNSFFLKFWIDKNKTSKTTQ